MPLFLPAILQARHQGLRQADLSHLVLRLLYVVDDSAMLDEALRCVEKHVRGPGVAISRLAQGVPIGGELDYLDEGTLAAAIKSRRRI